MKTPTITKEQLVVEIAQLRGYHAGLVMADEHRRKEFAKAFNWVKNAEFGVGNHIWKEPQLPSWEQIFVQVGKLLVLEELKQKIVFPPISKVV